MPLKQLYLHTHPKIYSSMKKLLLFIFLAPVIVMGQAPANDNPCGAMNLSINNSGYGFCTGMDFNMAGATYNSTFNNAGCSGDAQPDIWFKFIMPPSGNVKIYTSAQASSPDDDAVMQVFTSTDCNTSVNYLTCNDDGGAAPNVRMPFINLSYASGVTIYLRITQFSGLTNGLYNICVSIPPPLDNVTKVGIGVASPDSTLDVNGNMVVRGAMRIAGGFKLNAGTPGTGKVLTSDASGNGTWQAVSVPPSVGSTLIVTTSGAAPLPLVNGNGGADKSISFLTELADDLNQFNDSIFTAAAAGTYLVTFNTAISFSSGIFPNAERLGMRIYPSPGSFKYTYGTYPPNYTGLVSLSNQTVYKMTAGQTLKFQAYKYTNAGIFNIWTSEVTITRFN